MSDVVPDLTARPDPRAGVDDAPLVHAVDGDRTLDAVLRRSQEVLAQAGVPSPGHDAAVLAAHACDVERSAIATWTVLGARLDATQVTRMEALVARRARREPLQHIVGSAPFRRIELAVGPGVFVPRPETELVAQAAIDELATPAVGEPLVVDLCSGSGALALSIAIECPTAQVHAVEVSDDAVLWLHRNVEGLAVRDRVTVHHADAAYAPDGLDGLVDVVVCNPPYVPTGATIRDREAAEHDPPIALWGGPDGLDVVRAVIANAERLLRRGGLLLVEHADVQGRSLPALLSARAVDGVRTWAQVEDHRDLNGLPRFTSARRGAPSIEAAAR